MYIQSGLGLTVCHALLLLLLSKLPFVVVHLFSKLNHFYFEVLFNLKWFESGMRQLLGYGTSIMCICVVLTFCCSSTRVGKDFDIDT